MRLNNLHCALLGVTAINLVALVLGLSGQKASVVRFDSQKIQGQFIQQLAIYKASDSQINHATLQFKAQLKKTLSDYSQKHHVIILDKKMVLAGGDDVTDVLTNDLAKAMRSVS